MNQMQNSERILIPADIDADFVFVNHGDSMIDVRLFDGDIVYVKLQSDVENGEIAAVAAGDEIMLRRIYRTPDCIMLVPGNTLYMPRIFTGEAMKTIQIIGKAVAFTASLVEAMTP